MTQRERLFDLLDDCWDLSEYRRPTLGRIANYLLEKGVIIPPVKVGQIVYVITKTDIRTYKVHTIVVGDAYHKCYFFAEWYYDSLAFYSTDFDFADVGKTVFLTKEEAQKALEEREEDNG